MKASFYLFFILSDRQYEFTQTIFPTTFRSIIPKLNGETNILTVTWDDLASFTITDQNSECKNYEFKTRTNDPLKVTFNISNLHLYGGAECPNQAWPIESLTLKNDSFVSKTENGQAVLEAIWYTSNGFYLSVDKKVPLFVSLHKNELTLMAQRRHPYIRGDTTYLTYKICKYPNIKVAYQKAITDTIGKPTGAPDFRMTQFPIWSTWAQYKTNVDAQKVLQYADTINQHGLPNSQLEIDDEWEICYGSLKPDPQKFPDFKQLVTDLKRKGFRVTIWTYPFINLNCEPYYTEALKKDYFVKGPNGEVLTSWWEGKASLIDFTNVEAAGWWRTRLEKFRTETGIDSFKFDAGESSYGPQPLIFKQMLDDHPNTGLKSYIKTASGLGNMIEVRTGRSTQQYPIFVRINDLQSSWTGGSSLLVIIPELLHMTVIGYPFVLPDMVAGNRYGGENITGELFVRWLQLNTFMPSFQFSIPPWELGEEVKIRYLQSQINK